MGGVEQKDHIIEALQGWEVVVQISLTLWLANRGQSWSTGALLVVTLNFPYFPSTCTVVSTGPKTMGTVGRAQTYKSKTSETESQFCHLEIVQI